MAILTTVLNTILSLLLGFIVGYLTFCLVLWVSVHLFRPVAVVHGVEHPVMPIAQILFSFIVAIAVGLLFTRSVYTRIRKRSSHRRGARWSFPMSIKAKNPSQRPGFFEH